DSEPELFWALRGGKGNFGAVTAMECELFPQTRIYGGGVWFAIEHVPELMPAWSEWIETLPEEATSSVAVQRLPPLPHLPPPPPPGLAPALQGGSGSPLGFPPPGYARGG